MGPLGEVESHSFRASTDSEIAIPAAGIDRVQVRRPIRDDLSQKVGFI